MNSSNVQCSTISVVLVLESLESTLTQALSCFSGQTLEYKNFEILLVGDANLRSDVAELIQRYSSMSIRFLSMPEGAALGTAFNLGAQNARGDLVLIHHPELFADAELLSEHLLAHQIPSNQELAVFSTVVVDPALPPYLFNEGLRRANFLPRVNEDPQTVDGPDLQGLSVSLRRELFLGASPLRFSQDKLSRWGIEREFVHRLVRHELRLARHPHACCLQRTRYTLASFEKAVCEMTRDTAQLAESDSLQFATCPTVRAFSPALLPYWREHLKQSAPTVEILRNELSATEGLIARTHSEQFRAQSEDAINRIAECILLFREHLAQQTLVDLHEQQNTSLSESIETDKALTSSEPLSTLAIEVDNDREKENRH